MSVEPLTEHHSEFLSLKGGCTASSESTLVKMPHCWKSHVAAQIFSATYISWTGRNGVCSNLWWNFKKTLSCSWQLLSSLDYLCKGFGFRSGSTKCQDRAGSKLFDALMVFLRLFCKRYVHVLTLKAPRKTCIWKCRLKSSAANNCLA